MILVDTSIWVDHLRAVDRTLERLLDGAAVLVHPFVIGELALGHMRRRNAVLAGLFDLPHAVTATDAEVLTFIGRHTLFGRGIGYIDAHLLAAVQLTAGAKLWTRDKRLQSIANELAIGVTPPDE